MDCQKQMRKQIKSYPNGSAFMASDFQDFSDSATIKRYLLIFEKEGFIRRILRGVYDSPSSDSSSVKPAPNPQKVVEAIARNYKWTVVPNGEWALNILGLSTAPVSVFSYLTEGPSKKYAFNNIEVELKHRTNRELTKLSYLTALVVHAIKTLGKDADFTFVISHLAKQFSSDIKQAMLQEAIYVTNWVYEVIRKICTTL
jgi:hypothetical protein